MNNPKNKSLDNLKDDAVNGKEITGGTGVVFSAPDVYSPTNMPDGSDPLGATNHGDPTLAINDTFVDPKALEPGDDIFAPSGSVI